MKEAKLKSLRQKIEAVDDEILRLLNLRAQIVQDVGKVKWEMKVDPYSPRREGEVLGRLEAQSSGPFPSSAIPIVFREIISACRSLEGELRVAFLGPPATFSHMACIQHFGRFFQTVPQDTIRDVFQAVERGHTPYGVVPAENSTEGAVAQTLDLFMESDVKVCGEIMTKVSHALLSKSGRGEDVEKIYSHPQALAQCREWLRKHFPHVQFEETGSTARAAQIAMEEPESAAVASPLAADLYGLKAVATQIEDHMNNYTRFLVLGRQEAERTGKDKTSILFSIAHAPGTLVRALRAFCEQEINLTRIESRPTKGKPWEYIFFVDFEGHITDSRVKEVLDKVKKEVLFVKVLGSYPTSC